MLRGEFQHNLDSKGRISLPAAFRRVLPEQLVVTVGLEDSLCIFTLEDHERWVDSFFTKYGGYSELEKEHRKLRRALTSSASPIEIDSAGRVMIPANLRAKAHLEKEVTIIGNNDRIELWDTESWNEYLADDVSLDDLLSSL